MGLDAQAVDASQVQRPAVPKAPAQAGLGKIPPAPQGQASPSQASPGQAPPSQKPPSQAPAPHAPPASPHTILVSIEGPPGPPARWVDHWFWKNADFPSLMLNLIVLTLAIYGVMQAQNANKVAKATERRLYREAKFKPFDEAMLRPRMELEAAVQLLEDLADRGLNDQTFFEEIDQAGPLIVPVLLTYRNQLRAIDSADVYGLGWDLAFQPFNQRAETAYDEAHDTAHPLARRKEAAGEIAVAIKQGLEAMTRFEFDQRQSWGATDKITRP